MAKRLKLKSGVKFIIAGIIILIIAIVAFIKIRANYIYHQSYEYLLLNKGYESSEIKKLEKYFNEDELYLLTTKDKDLNLLKFIDAKNYKHKNYDRYVAYQKSNKNLTIDEVVHMVNINRDFDFYEKVSIANINKGNTILVNKYYKLEEDYVPENLVTINLKYTWGRNNQIKEEVYDAFIEMWKAAQSEDENIYLMINSSYRSYGDQKDVYERYEKANNTRYADSIAARAGHSEHQTGLALDIFDLHNSNMNTFKDSKTFAWLKDNSYKYGFILRYPENAENITGFDYEPWHYRYVGTTVAKIIHDKNITLEEYYYNEY